MTQWAAAIKTKLGNVYHVVYLDEQALCDPRIRLDVKDKPLKCDYRCKRCQRLTAHTSGETTQVDRDYDPNVAPCDDAEQP